ncbi:hypothetical protein FQN52_001322 [Onygenales sp. PD_12]|nr:hypothetical protein FQN52_001322 [Onygenales sp. PD_12]
MDDQSLEAMIQLMRLDITDALAVGNGNNTDASLTDRDIALRLYQEDLNTLQVTLNDRRMARSITGAVQQDGDVLDIFAREEDRARHDREIAVNMGGNRNPTVGTPQQTNVTTDETLEEAENEKLAEENPTKRGRETDCLETQNVNVCDVHGPEEARRECAAFAGAARSSVTCVGWSGRPAPVHSGTRTGFTKEHTRSLLENSDLGRHHQGVRL